MVRAIYTYIYTLFIYLKIYTAVLRVHKIEETDGTTANIIKGNYCKNEICDDKNINKPYVYVELDNNSNNSGQIQLNIDKEYNFFVNFTHTPTNLQMSQGKIENLNTNELVKQQQQASIYTFAFFDKNSFILILENVSQKHVTIHAKRIEIPVVKSLWERASPWLLIFIAMAVNMYVQSKTRAAFAPNVPPNNSTTTTTTGPITNERKNN